MNPLLILEARNAVGELLRAHPELAHDDQLREDMVEGSTSLPDVIRQLLLEATAAEAMAAGIKEAELALGLRKERLKHRAERIRATMLSLMQMAGMKKLPLPEGTVTVTLRPPEPIRPDSLDGIPEDFLKTKVELDWAAMKSAAKEGRTFDGLKWSNGTAQITIRT